MKSSKDIREGNFTIDDMREWFENNNISFQYFSIRVNDRLGEQSK